MTQVTLTDEEIGALTQLLEGALSELSHEIADTDRMDFREEVKARRELLRRALEKLQA